MNNREINKIVPRLRFPEFKDSGEWDINPLGNIAENLDYKRVPITENERKKGNIPYYGASGIIDYVQDYIFSGKLLCISEDGANLVARTTPIAFSISGKSWVNNHAHVLKFENNFTQIIIENYLNAINLEDFLTGMAQPKLNRTKLDEIPIPLPQLKEQQKIADCLSSVDDLITAEMEKLAQLKGHKKGLMQNLFPAEEGAVPNLRFLEFTNSGEWEKKIIGEISTVTAGGTPDSVNEKYWNGDIPWMNSGELNQKKVYEVSNKITLQGLKESSTKLIPSRCVLIGLAGQGKTRGTAAINYIELCTNQSIASIHPNDKVFVSEFLYYKIDSMYEQLRVLSAGDGGRGGLNLQIIKSIVIHLPNKDEQQKIADCLSSVDELITSQAQKTETLKLYKKGLMQQLFPVINEKEE